MSSRRQWIVAEPDQRVAELAQQHQLSPLVVQVLLNRGLDEADMLGRFLSPQLGQLRDPSTLAGMDQAVTRLVGALEAREQIGVFGDYDVDGVTSTAVVSWTLNQLGGRVLRHVPHRLLDGYGLSEAGLRVLADQGASLIVAVDCGVTAHAEIRAAQAMGLDVIVVDHHALEASLPDAVAVVDPLRSDDHSGLDGLAAVGLAFFLCVALRRALRERGFFATREEPDLRQLLDLVALGTVADQVPLTDQNRILVHAGLKVLQQASRPGIQALCEVARADPARLTSSRLAFQLAPRINAAGRLGDAMAAVDLMLTDDPVQARSLASMLDVANSERRSIENLVFEQACALVEAAGRGAIPEAIVIGDPGWHPGVVGIVASRLVERYGRPSLLVGAEGRGSGRSVPGFNLHEALAAVQHHLIGFGGHAQAVGVRMRHQDLPALQNDLASEAARALGQAAEAPPLMLDARLRVAELDIGLAEELQRLAPFGRGNPEPLFVLDDVHFVSRSQVGGHHVRFVVEEAGRTASGIAFHMADRLEAGDFADGAQLAVVPEVDEWNGRRRLSLRTVDVIAPL
ncbi:MAG: single-stranded-DNA-specific exonuclease RecJ [Pseudomonadota bacterium]